MQKNKNQLEELNKKAHDLNYVVNSGGSPSVRPDIKKGRQLAEKIRKNIEEYQNEVDAPSRHSFQT